MRQPTWREVTTTDEFRRAVITAAINDTSAHDAAADLDPDIHPGASTAAWAAQSDHADACLVVLLALTRDLIDREAEEGRR